MTTYEQRNTSDYTWPGAAMRWVGAVAADTILDVADAAGEAVDDTVTAAREVGRELVDIATEVGDQLATAVDETLGEAATWFGADPAEDKGPSFADLIRQDEAALEELRPRVVGGRVWQHDIPTVWSILNPDDPDRPLVSPIIFAGWVKHIPEADRQWIITMVPSIDGGEHVPMFNAHELLEYRERMGDQVVVTDDFGPAELDELTRLAQRLVEVSDILDETDPDV